MSSAMQKITKEELAKRVLRYDELIPCKTAFIDAKTPGSDKKENFCLVGPGVSENPDQYIHIAIPHGFNIGAAKQPNGCKNSHHSHETEEIFLVHSGSWKFTIGEKGEDAQVVLNEGDLISIPTNVFRGFENVGDDEGFLFCVLGQDDPGHVTWSPYVFENAKEHGLVLLEDGRLIDTEAGVEIPEDGTPVQATTREEADKMQHFNVDDVKGCIITQAQFADAFDGAKVLHQAKQVNVIGGATPSDETLLNWPHCFSVDRAELAAAGEQSYSTEENEVLFVQDGQVSVDVEGIVTELFKGDLITIPPHHRRTITNSSDQKADLLKVVKG